MKKIFPILTALCVFFGSGLAASAQDKTAGKPEVRQLEAIYQEFDAATKKRDLKTFEKYLGEKFEVRQGDKNFSRDEILAVMQMLFDAAIEISEVATKIEKVSLKDNNYLLETSTVLKGKFKMPDGKISDVEIQSKSTDRWLKTEKGWKEIFQIDRGSKFLADGKEVPM